MNASLWAEDLTAAAKYCKRHHPQRVALTLSVADDLLENRFIFRDHWELERTGFPVVLPFPVDWFFRPGEDPEWTYAMNRHNAFVVLGKAWRYTGDRRYAAHFAALIGDWIENVQLTQESKKNAWRSLETGLRCETWLRALRLFSGSDLLDEALIKKIEGSLALHAQHLIDTHLPYHQLSNWGVLQDFGLFLLGVHFGRSDWLETAQERLLQQISVQIMEDGVHWEQSPMYHGEVLHCMLQVTLAARQNQLPLDPHFLRQVEKMCHALAAWLKPDGRLICQSDSDNIDARDLLAAGAVLFSDAGLRFWAGERLLEENVWDFGEWGIALFDRLAPEAPARCSAALTDSGNYILRSDAGSDALYLNFHCGSIGGGHGHIDLLHFGLGAYCEDILIDSGRYTYVNTPLRLALKAPAAHNTIVVDNVDFGRSQDSWSFSLVPRYQKGEHKLSEALDYVSGLNLSYLNLPEGAVVLTRHILYLKPDIIVVLDQFDAVGTHCYTQYFHLGAGVSDFSGDTLHWQGARAAMLLKTVNDGAAHARSTAPYSPDYNELLEGELLTTRYTHTGSGVLATVIWVGEKGQEPPLEAQFVPVQSALNGQALPDSTAVAVELRWGEKKGTVLLRLDERASTAGLLVSGALTAYGRLVVAADGKTQICSY